MTKSVPDTAPMKTRLESSIPVSPWYTSKEINSDAVMMIMTPDEEGISPDVDVVSYDQKPYAERMSGGDWREYCWYSFRKTFATALEARDWIRARNERLFYDSLGVKGMHSITADVSIFNMGRLVYQEVKLKNHLRINHQSQFFYMGYQYLI